jgi:hypothetical protein
MAVALVAAILAVFLSLSRGGIAALFVTVMVMAAIYVRAKLIDAKYGWGALAIGLLMIGLLSLYGYERVSQELSTLTRGSLDAMDSEGARRNIWQANLLAIQAGGAFGSGAGSHKVIYPLYLPDSVPFEYSHAENGYLQIATETGYVGVLLLAVLLVICGLWCFTCLLRLTADQDQIWFGATAGGLAASLAHSLVDFVWYVPACMSVTVVLSAIALRLSQLAKSADSTSCWRVLPRARWAELSVASLLAGAWSIHTFSGPAIGSVYWDRYMRLSASNSELTEQQWSELVARDESSDDHNQAPLNDLMIGQLERVAKWNPDYARAHLRLAAKYITKFELLQLQAENAMSRAQIQDAVRASRFKSQHELDAWLNAAFGANIEWLRRAATEARHAVSLSPLQGEGYLYLADLSFLDIRDAARAESYVEQALRVRPYDSDVHYSIGNRAWQKGDIATALEHWRTCFPDDGPHQFVYFHVSTRLGHIAANLAAIPIVRSAR